MAANKLRQTAYVY